MVQLESLVGVGLILVVAFVSLAVGARVLQSVNASLPASSFDAYNIISNGMTGLTNLSAQGGLIGTIVGLSIVLALLIGVYVFFTGRSPGAGA